LVKSQCQLFNKTTLQYPHYAKRINALYHLKVFLIEF
jgi:hypothetical protein